MKDYEKPVLLSNDEVFEGIYAASGASEGGDCYTVTAYIHQSPETGRGDFRIQVDAVHAASDGHHSTEQVLALSFNQPVEYVSSQGTLVSGSGTSTINIKYNYHNNAYENIGLGDVCVTSNAGLSVTGAVLTCNHQCEQHG